VGSEVWSSSLNSRVIKRWRPATAELIDELFLPAG